jgi:hypothetical protein
MQFCLRPSVRGFKAKFEAYEVLSPLSAPCILRKSAYAMSSLLRIPEAVRCCVHHTLLLSEAVTECVQKQTLDLKGNTSTYWSTQRHRSLRLYPIHRPVEPACIPGVSGRSETSATGGCQPPMVNGKFVNDEPPLSTLYSSAHELIHLTKKLRQPASPAQQC